MKVELTEEQIQLLSDCILNGITANVNITNGLIVSPKLREAVVNEITGLRKLNSYLSSQLSMIDAQKKTTKDVLDILLYHLKAELLIEFPENSLRFEAVSFIKSGFFDISEKEIIGILQENSYKAKHINKLVIAIRKTKKELNGKRPSAEYIEALEFKIIK